MALSCLYTVFMNSIFDSAQPVPGRVPGTVPGLLPGLLPVASAPLWLGVAGDSVAAGFPSPAEDFAVNRVDLTAKLITHPQATFLLKVSGESMRDAGIFNGDTLVVNKALKPRHGHIVVAVVDGEFTVKQLYQRAGRVKLLPANPTYPEIRPKEGQTLEIWGVVTACVKWFSA